jgi:spermidine/putrescine transport system substrate-binding protein
MIRELVRRARAAQLTRRTVLAGTGASALAMMLAACSPAGASKKLTPAKDVSDSNKNMTWANWQAYLDQNDSGKYPTLQAFEKKTGISVKYDVAVDDNNTYYAKVKDQLALGKDIGADTVCLTDWMVARLIRLDYVQTFGKDAIPNKKNLKPALQDPDFDPGRTKSLP